MHQAKNIVNKITSDNIIVDLSIIIPLFNGLNYLMMCLNSIFQQTIKPREVIIVDDVSTDKSYEYCQTI